GKRISIIQDEIGYTFDPPLTGVTIESWRYRKRPPPLPDLEQLAAALLTYKAADHSPDWLTAFLESGGHPYPEALREKYFPAEASMSDNRYPVSESGPSDTGQRTSDIAPPPALTAYLPPTPEGFVGREADLKRFRAALERTGLAIIVGMAGVGKTTLASQIATEMGGKNQVFWHSFYDGAITPFIRRMAGFLANHERPDLWEMLESARSAGIKPPDQTTALDLISAQIAGLDFLICLDDLQFVDEEPGLAPFLQKLLADRSRLLITSRRLPTFLPGDNLSLEGLSPQDTESLVSQRGVYLLPEQVIQLHQVTGGHGAFVTLATVALRHARDVADLLNSLATVDNIERFLMEAVNDRLSANEQRVMEGVAILGGYPGTRDVIEEMLNQRDVRRTLRALADQHLLTISEGEMGREYNQHQIVQAFYYEQPRRSERRALHARAADFYQYEEVDPFKAALHHARAQNSEMATEIGTKHLWEIVNQGMAKPLVEIFDRLPDEGLEDNARFELWLAQGQLDHLLGDIDNGRERFEKAAQRLQEMSVNAATDQLKARVCLHMAELLERQSPLDALTWAQRGLQIDTGKTDLNAALTIKTGTLMMHMGNLGGALETFETVLDREAELPEVLRSDLLMNLSGTTAQLGQFEIAEEHARRALESSQRRRDLIQMSQVLSNLSFIQYIKGEWQAATSGLEQAIEMAERLGATNELLTLSSNLGTIYVDMGETDVAQKHLNRAIQLGDLISAQQALVARNNLIQLMLDNGQYEGVEALIEHVIDRSQSENYQIFLPLADLFRARFLAGTGRVQDGLGYVESAIQAYKALGDQSGLEHAYRVRGELALEVDDRKMAQKSLDKAVELLPTGDAYRMARIHLLQGRLAMANGKVEEGTFYFQQAIDKFETLGAHQFVEKSKEMIKTHSKS
ncbi:MAG: tetratricopeptide repeat protein, partial [Chloroflexota bacterium]